MSDNLFNTIYNPDVLSCIANLSNDEVFTPPEVANAMLDMLPQELFSDPNATFLDPACKSGVFLREIAKRLLIGLEDRFPDLQERVDHIFQKQLFGIAITELTSLLARRSLYCSKYPNSVYSVTKFDNVQGNIRFKNTQHRWVNGKCAFCGASESEYGGKKREGRETHAYEFIHTIKPQEIWKMKFDVIIGNPPYQMSDGGNGASAMPLYNRFISQAKKINPRYLCMIIPARWYAGGRALSSFRDEMLNDKRIKVLVDFPQSKDCFPGVEIAGGVCYFLWERDFNGECTVINSTNGKSNSLIRPLNEYSIFVRNNIGVNIIHKVRKHPSFHPLSDIMTNYNPFLLRSYVVGEDKPFAGSLKLLSSRGYSYINRDMITKSIEIIDRYKVIITYAMSGGNKASSQGDYQVVSSLFVLKPGEVCSESYLILGDFDNEKESRNLQSYVATKFFRFLLLQSLTSIHITKDSFQFVPLLDFNKSWCDEELYKLYGLSNSETAYIEDIIKPLELDKG